MNIRFCLTCMLALAVAWPAAPLLAQPATEGRVGGGGAEMTPVAPGESEGQAAPEAGRYTQPLQPSRRAFENISMRLIDNLLESEQYPDALAAINQWMERDGAPLGQLFMKRGAARQAAGDHFHAAMDHLRVPIHFPGHPGAFEATVSAAENLIAIEQYAAAAKVLDQAERMASSEAQNQAVAEQRNALPD